MISFSGFSLAFSPVLLVVQVMDKTGIFIPFPKADSFSHPLPFVVSALNIVPGFLKL
jgi:hypothetical protein